MGIVVMQTAAKKSGQSVAYFLKNCRSPRGMVRILSRLTKTRARKNSFHISIPWKTATTAIPGLAIGMTIVKKVLSGEHPSITAASSSSLGIDRKYALSRKIEKARPDEQYVSTSDALVLSSPRSLTKVNSGITSTPAGTISERRKR